MKILFITTRWPLPPITGDRLRSYYILKELSKDHEVTLISFCNTRHELKMMIGSRVNLQLRPVRYHSRFSYLKAFRGLFSREPLQLHFYRFKKMQRVVNEELEHGAYDLVFASMIRGAQYVAEFQGLPKIVDLIDAVSLTYQRILDYPGMSQMGIFSQIYRLEQKRVRKYEIETTRKFSKILVVSEIDRECLKKSGAADDLVVIPNGVNTTYFRFSENNHDPYRITFHGNLHYHPNTDAILYFYRDIFPLVKQKEPRARLYIVGNNPRKEVLNLARDEKVFVTGRINDIRPYLLDTAVSICPVRMGAGVQNKILEAMSVGIPVVTTTLGLEGIQAENHREVVIADDPRSFAEAVLELMHDPNYRTSIREQARALIERRYSWGKALAPLKEIVHNLGEKSIIRNNKRVGEVNRSDQFIPLNKTRV